MSRGRKSAEYRRWAEGDAGGINKINFKQTGQEGMLDIQKQ